MTKKRDPSDPRPRTPPEWWTIEDDELVLADLHSPEWRRWSRHRGHVRASNRARQRARTRLIREHQSAYDKLYIRAARLEGVEPSLRYWTEDQREQQSTSIYDAVTVRDQAVLDEVEPVHASVEDEVVWIRHRIVRLMTMLSRELEG